MSRSKGPPIQTQRSLFDHVAPVPQWEQLPVEVRQLITELLSELLISPPAQELLRRYEKGGVHE